MTAIVNQDLGIIVYVQGVGNWKLTYINILYLMRCGQCC